MNQEASQDTDLGLLDATLMQNLQDRFCDANNVYLVCLSRTRGVVTKAYGSKEELAYIHGLTGVERHMTLMNRLLDDGIESVLEEDCGNDLVKVMRRVHQDRREDGGNLDRHRNHGSGRRGCSILCHAHDAGTV